MDNIYNIYIPTGGSYWNKLLCYIWGCTCIESIGKSSIDPTLIVILEVMDNILPSNPIVMVMVMSNLAQEAKYLLEWP